MTEIKKWGFGAAPLKSTTLCKNIYMYFDYPRTGECSKIVNLLTNSM